MIEPGDRLLCIDNGIFGKGFGDFAEIYGAEVVYLKVDYRKPVDVEELESFLEKDDDFKLATLVHCETPSAIINPVDKICPLLRKHGIISIVDSVASVGGEPLEVDKWKMDIVIGGSQKCISAPPGLTFLSINKKAWDVILNRKTPIKSFYCNLAIWKDWYKDKWFPYTQPISDIYALNAAVTKILEEKDSIERHREIGEAIRKSLVKAGLELYPLDGFANTVTTLLVPEGVKFSDVYDRMLDEHNILIAGAFDHLKDKVIRIGNMGENAREEKIYITLKALSETFKHLGVKLDGELHKHFVNAM